MLFPNINNVVMSLGRITPTGVSLLGTAFLLDIPGNLVTAAHRDVNSTSERCKYA